MSNHIFFFVVNRFMLHFSVKNSCPQTPSIFPHQFLDWRRPKSTGINQTFVKRAALHLRISEILMKNIFQTKHLSLYESYSFKCFASITFFEKIMVRQKLLHRVFDMIKSFINVTMQASCTDYEIIRFATLVYFFQYAYIKTVSKQCPISF